MTAFLENKFVLVIIIGLAVAGAAWYGLTSSSGDGSLITTTDASAGPGQDLVETLLALRAVKLDGAIFSQPSFAGLVDFSTPIVPEPVGRPNPFAPLFFSATPTSTKEAGIFAPQTGGSVSAKNRVTH